MGKFGTQIHKHQSTRGGGVKNEPINCRFVCLSLFLFPQITILRSTGCFNCHLPYVTLGNKNQSYTLTLWQRQRCQL